MNALGLPTKARGNPSQLAIAAMERAAGDQCARSESGAVRS